MNIHEIGWVETCYDEKFGVPRQSGVVGSAWGKISFHEDYQSANFIRGLEGFSHLWLVFVFHQAVNQSSTGGKVKATVRPPRLGGNEKVGVFASRSPFRPNPIGLSLVKLERIEASAKGSVLHVSGVDLVSGTPLLDIKPYIPYCDSVSKQGGEIVQSGYVNGAPENLAVEWGDEVEVDPGLKQLITETISVDPRPAYHNDEREYGCLIAGVNVRWQVIGGLDSKADRADRVVKILSCARV
ncbi:MAG: tRNA-Thr(GGU) m(6)t(6)A37 methyltransferase TsaA [Cryomorphaceae bacterium]|jgi:tRNA-Thr(GGU) m(6)t(6)A37 methyltransferase TsaA